jgi:hypothetical protein
MLGKRLELLVENHGAPKPAMYRATGYAVVGPFIGARQCESNLRGVCSRLVRIKHRHRRAARPVEQRDGQANPNLPSDGKSISARRRVLHRPERGARGRPCRDDRTKRSRSTFSACSARSNHCFCSCSKLASVTGSVAAAAAISHLRASQRRFSDRALMQIRDS